MGVEPLRWVLQGRLLILLLLLLSKETASLDQLLLKLRVALGAHQCILLLSRTRLQRLLQKVSLLLVEEGARRRCKLLLARTRRQLLKLLLHHLWLCLLVQLLPQLL